MPRRSQYDEDDFDYEDDEYENVRKLRRPREDRELEKKKRWERESIPDDYDERR